VQPEELREGQYGALIKRAYSISCSLLDSAGKLARVRECPYLEFYVALVRKAEQPPALTPRLFKLRAGDRLWCGPRMHGNYTLQHVHGDETVIFVATGTGEAPHNAMIAELLCKGHRGRIISAVCVRWRKDLAYIRPHSILEQRFPRYRYLPLTTREPENIDPTLPNYVGKRYLQDYFASGDFERDAGIQLVPQRSHVFLCGSPDMIGIPRHTHDPAERYPQPRGMVEVLEQRGFQVDQPYEPGNIHFERYW
jgi:ferredoxin--NADP+ reductase